MARSLRTMSPVLNSFCKAPPHERITETLHTQTIISSASETTTGAHRSRNWRGRQSVHGCAWREEVAHYSPQHGQGVSSAIDTADHFQTQHQSLGWINCWEPAKLAAHVNRIFRLHGGLALRIYLGNWETTWTLHWYHNIAAWTISSG